MVETALITAEQIRNLAAACGFEIAGVAAATPDLDFTRYQAWREQGFAAGMTYLTDHRGDLRQDLRSLLPSVQSVICVGKLYNTGGQDRGSDYGQIARYARGTDYHVTMRQALQRLHLLVEAHYGEKVEARVCVDTAPVLERSLARRAGLGWIGKNTCLINQERGSWFLLGELLISIPITPDTPPPDRCGTCRRCLEACPTQALLPSPDGGSYLDAGRCISYLTIEHRGSWAEGISTEIGNNVFGCDICQEVCPWNREAAVTYDPAFLGWDAPEELAQLACLSPEEYARLFRHTPVSRARYADFLRNVAAAMGNGANSQFVAPLESLAQFEDETVATVARESLERLKRALTKDPAAD